MSQAPAVDYAVQIIEFLSDGPGAFGITEISSALDINKSAVSRILGALVECGWVYCSDPDRKKYALTLRPFSFISKSVSKDTLQRVARPYVEAYHHETGDCVYLGVRNGKDVLYTLHHQSTSDVQIAGRLGGSYPLHCAAAGKVLLAAMPEREAEAYFEKYAERRTPNTITDFETFRTEARKIRAEGYAADNEEFGKGIVCLAVPVLNADGQVIAALGVSTLTFYYDFEALLAARFGALTRTAGQISAALGCTEKPRER